MNLKTLIVNLGCFAALATSQAFAQSITSFSPTVGAPGDTVTIKGSGFYYGGSITVQFWKQKTAIIVYTSSDTQITVTVPNGVSSGPISVFRTGGQPSYSPYDFTVVGNGPYITDFSPAYGATNSQNPVTINGVHFTGATSVKFNGVSASSFQVANADGTQIIAYIPRAATTGPISVTTGYGTGQSPASFVVVDPHEPYVASFSPSTGNPEDLVTITGLHFTDVTNVQFDGVSAVFTTPTSDTELKAYVPRGAMSGPITVSNPYGTSASAGNFYLLPQVTSFSPASAPTGSSIVISGSNLTDAYAVTLNGTSVPFTVNSNTRITAVVPEGATTGPIRVSAPAGQSPPSENFVVLPTITGFTPNQGGAGTRVTISGQNLLGTTAVSFNGVAAVFGNVTYSQMTATVPATATTGPIAVTTTNGVASSGTNLFYLPARLTSFAPTKGDVGSVVTISGNNFIGATAVTFNSIPAEFSVAYNTTLYATVPAGASSGPIMVTAPAGMVTSGSQNFYLPPMISGFAPDHGLPGTNVTVFGDNFLGATSVSFNGTAVNLTPLTNNTSFQVAVPANASTGPISLTAPGGSAVSSGPFTLDYASDLGVRVAASPNPVYVGSNLTYTITFTNAGPFNAPYAALTNTLPASVALQSVTNTLGTLSTNGDSIVLSIQPFLASTYSTLTLRVVPQAVGSITNRAAAAGAYPDPSPYNNTNALVTTVIAVPPPPPPPPAALLTIEPYASTLLKISWPSALTNYVLQFSPALGSDAGWSKLSTEPIVSGTNNIVIESRSERDRFYRLKR